MVAQLDAQMQADQAQIDAAQAEPRLRAHHLAHRRRDGRAPGRPRQRRARHRRRRASSSSPQLDPDRGLLHAAGGRSARRSTRRMATASSRGGAAAATATRPLGQGKLTVIDNEINQQTATLKLKAVFDNPKHLLWPNQFVKARLQLVDARERARRPGRGRAARAAGDVRVRREGATRHVAMRPVTRRRHRRATSRSSASGLAAGEQVVVDGQAQLRPGAKVATKPAERPDRAARVDRGPRAPRCARHARRAASHERRRLRAVHPAAGRDDAADGGPASRRARGLHAAARRGAAAGRLPDHRRLDVPARGQRRHDGLGRDDAARAPVRADAVAHADDQRVELRLLADHAAVRPRPEHRRRAAGRAGGDQRGVEPAARRSCRRRRRTRRATRPTSRS